MTQQVKDGKTITFIIDYDLTATTADDLSDEIRLVIDNESPEKLVFDLENSKMVDSIGIGVLITAFNMMKKTWGSTEVINTSKEVFHVFKAMRLEMHFEVKQKE